MKIKTIYCLKDGSSKFGVMEFDYKGGDSISANSIGNLTSMFPVTGICFRETPADYKFSWHTAPQRQFIINLDAAVEVTTSDGERNVFENGEIFFVEDTHGKGHFSQSVDNKPRRYDYEKNNFPQIDWIWAYVSEPLRFFSPFLDILAVMVFLYYRSVFISVPDSFPGENPEVRRNYVP